jgi:hypothetical protein
MTSADHDPGGERAATPSGMPDEASAPTDFAVRAKLAFPVVGIGASAGDVDALRTFFAASSPDSGMAYIVIQQQHTPSVPAVAVTAFARSEDRQRALSAGFDEPAQACGSGAARAHARAAETERGEAPILSRSLSTLAGWAPLPY